MIRKKIPIVILTRDEPHFLKMMIESIISRTKYPFHIFIVDNNSNGDEQLSLLDRLDGNNKITVIYNTKNQWILGFNKALPYYENDTDFNKKYAVLSDGDMLVPYPENNICWLEYLITKMERNVTIGKIGLCLKTDYIKANLPHIYKIEKKYMQGPIVDDLIIAPVDTTIAIYRKDIFLPEHFKMIPGHASIIKPYYYVCRTNDKYHAEHLGWTDYKKNQSSTIDKKIICFTIYAAFIDPLILRNGSKKATFFYLILRYPCKLFWSTKVLSYWIIYFIKNYPRNYNQIQSKYR